MSRSDISSIQSILLSILLVTSIFYFNDVLAQEDEEEEEEDKEDEEEGNKGEEEEEKEGSSEESSSSNEQNEEAPKEAVEEQPEPIIETPPTPPPPPTLLNFSQPVIENTAVPPPIEEEAIQQQTPKGGQFNATCKCYTTDNNNNEKLISHSTDTASIIQQIPLTDTNIQTSESIGEIIDPAYTDFYTVSKVLDNKVDDISFWSQAGKSSFYIKLDSTLDGYQVCSMDIIANKVTNSPFTLDIGGIQENFTGVIDQIPKKVQFNACYKNVDEFIMSFDNPEDQFISIAELKLFGKSLSSTTALPTTTATTTTTKEQPTTTPKINIEGSNAEIDIKNSTVTFKFDPLTGTFVGQPS